MPDVGFRHSAESKQKIAEATARQWQDPNTRAKMSAGLKAAQVRRRAALTVCSSCGQPLTSEEGRD